MNTRKKEKVFDWSFSCWQFALKTCCQFKRVFVLFCESNMSFFQKMKMWKGKVNNLWIQVFWFKVWKCYPKRKYGKVKSFCFSLLLQNDVKIFAKISWYHFFAKNWIWALDYLIAVHISFQCKLWFVLFITTTLFWQNFIQFWNNANYPFLYFILNTILMTIDCS